MTLLIIDRVPLVPPVVINVEAGAIDIQSDGRK